MENPYTMPFPQAQPPQGQKPGQPPAPEKKKFEPKTIFALIFLVVAGIVVAKVVLDSMAPKKPTSLSESYAVAKKGQPRSQRSVQPKAAVEAKLPLVAFKKKVQESVEQFTLNGIYFEGETPFALVNNKVVQEGDTVDKAVVQKITMEGVELKTEDKIIRLTTRGR
jgi:hypothetical protein